MKIPYFIRNVYGKPQAYVATAELRHAIRMMTRRECLDEMDLTALRELGHEPELVLDPASLNKMYGSKKVVSRGSPVTDFGRRAVNEFFYGRT